MNQTLDIMIDKVAKLEQSQNKYNSYGSFVSAAMKGWNRGNSQGFNLSSSDHIVNPSSKESNRLSSVENHPAS